jgi:hypothetical protein
MDIVYKMNIITIKELLSKVYMTIVRANLQLSVLFLFFYLRNEQIDDEIYRIYIWIIFG